jgi:hypothetical protein
MTADGFILAGLSRRFRRRPCYAGGFFKSITAAAVFGYLSGRCGGATPRRRVREIMTALDAKIAETLLIAYVCRSP